jgi:hypothetical protein
MTQNQNALAKTAENWQQPGLKYCTSSIKQAFFVVFVPAILQKGLAAKGGESH